MSFATTYVTTGFVAESTACPAMGMLFAGLKTGSKAYDALTGATAGFSDGASVTLKAILTGSTYAGASGANADLTKGCQIWFGNGLAAAAATNGAYVVGQTWAARAGGALNVTQNSTGAYHSTANTKAAAALKISTGSSTNIATGGDKYQWTGAAAASDLADNTMFFHMPYSKTHKAKTAGELSATDGDRLDKGDEVNVFNGKQFTGSEAATDACGTKVVVKLGAATLAAGSVALAAALAF